MAKKLVNLAPEVHPAVEASSLEELAKMPRMSSVMKGLKQGMLKGGFDTLVGTIAGPIREKIAPALKNMGGTAEILEPAVGLAIEFAIMLGIAEMITLFAPMVPGEKKAEMVERGQLLSTWMREYAGERAGKQVLDAALALFPLIMAHFSEISLQDLKEIQGQEQISAPAEVEEVATQI